MLFNSIAFLLFYAFLHFIYWNAKHKYRKMLLLLGSAIFYGYWSIPFLFHFLLIISINYIFYNWTRLNFSLSKLNVIIGLNFLNLIFFKYSQFIRNLFFDLGFSGPLDKIPESVLPLAISFYTFQIVAFHIDAYRNRIPNKVSYSDFTLFIMFFPQLIAGPILRSDEFIAKINTNKKASAIPVDNAIVLILIGLVKKILIADNISPIVEPVFSNPEAYNYSGALVAIYGFAIQIYCDFAGYTDIARGTALLFGFRMPANFKAPYFSTTLREFWRRWHITLSSWLRDYLYIPLGGNRFGAFRTYLNLLITMGLGGLWHGANYTFIIWGLLHGFYLCIEKFFGLAGQKINLITRIFRSALTFHLICFAWIFFRADSISIAIKIILRLFSTEGVLPTGTNRMAICLTLFLFLHLLEYYPRIWKIFSRYGKVLVPVSTIIAGFIISGASSKASAFIYFQF